MQEIICDFQVAIGKGNTFVVRVHSDNDNSMIAEVKDYLREECIEQTFTEPYDHNANAKVERKNRKLMGIFRTCLIEATQGSGKYKELWCVGLEHAAMALIRKQSSTRNKTLPCSFCWCCSVLSQP